MNDQAYIYIKSEPGLYTVGFYSPDGKWEPESDHSDMDKAAERTHFMNGGCGHKAVISKAIAELHVAEVSGLPEDDQLIAGHIRTAKALLESAMGVR